jgi:hypothetical protein
VVTARGLVDPELTVWALLELGSLHKFEKGLVTLCWVLSGLELGACHSFVILNPAVEAVVLFALNASEICVSP